MKTDDGGILKLKDADFDFLIKQKIADLIDAGISHNINSDLRKSFEAFKGLMLMLIGYEHNHKEELLELTEVLTDYFDSLNHKATRRDQVITKHNERLELRVLLDQYMSSIFKSYKELGLWLSTRIEYNDFEKELSMENFNSEYTALGEKKTFLLNQDKTLIVNNLTPNMIHDLFGKLELKKALGEE